LQRKINNSITPNTVAEGQEFCSSLWHGFYQLLTVLFDLLSRYYIGIMACVKDDLFPVCCWISCMTVSFQPDKDVRKSILIWNRIRIRIFDLKRFIRYILRMQVVKQMFSRF